MNHKRYLLPLLLGLLAVAGAVAFIVYGPPVAEDWQRLLVYLVLAGMSVSGVAAFCWAGDGLAYWCRKRLEARDG